jgi:hypothetical protein
MGKSSGAPVVPRYPRAQVMHMRVRRTRMCMGIYMHSQLRSMMVLRM